MLKLCVNAGFSVTIALADFVGSATLVAVMVVEACDFTVGAVYKPLVLIEPEVADHVTPLFTVPDTLAVN
jgi:hypothetical protein